MTRTNIPFTELDFLPNKEALKAYLKNQEQFKDYDFEGSNLNVLLDVLSYNTWMNNYYVHAAFSEMFLDSAQLRQNINSHAKELGYLPRSRTSSRSLVDVQLTVPPTSTPSFISIPRNTKFIGKCSTGSYTFYNDTSVTIFPQAGVYRAYDVEVFEGTLRNEAYTVIDTQPKRYVIRDEKVDTSSVRVFVRDNALATSASTEYTYKENVFGSMTDDKVFYLQPYAENKYEVYFGRDLIGHQPKNGQVITIEYRTTHGEEANGIRKFTIANPISGFQSNVFTTGVSEGGSERESLEDIRFFAPKYAQVQQRAVVEDDYSILLKQAFPEIQAVSVYGGEKADPPMFGATVVSLDINNSSGVTFDQSRKYKNFLLERAPISIEPIIVPAQYMNVEVTAGVLYNTSYTSQTTDDIRAKVSEAVQKFNDDELNDFGLTLRSSRLSKYLDSADNYIISNQVYVRPVLEHIPELNTPRAFLMKFENPLDYDVTDYTTYSGPHDRPAIVTSNFTFDGFSVFIMDNGAGLLNIVRLNTVSNQIETYRSNVGTVNYNTGEVYVSGFSTSAFEGTAIKFYGNPRSKDIVCPVNKVISIKPEDTYLSITGTRK